MLPQTSYPGPPPDPPPTAAPPAPDVRAPGRGSLYAVRLLTTVHALQAIAQPLLIGAYLDGDYDAVGLHGANGNLLMLSLMGAGIAVLVHCLRGGPVWPVPALTALWLAEGIQIGMGHARDLSVHVPLGVTVVALAVALAVWAWTPRARRPRARGAR